jgi:site-specific DNA-methyltransferase (adenine-specific)
MSVTILQGDCRERMAELEAESIDSCVTDPPYHLTSIVKRFGAANAAPAKAGKTGAYARASKGFMGQTWDGGDVAFQPATWAAVHRVLKPGAHLVAFSGTRTYHRMVCAIEDAGFEIRDQLAWVYGQGFPKSHDVSKGIDRMMGAERTESLRASPWNARKPNGSAGVSSVGLNATAGAPDIMAPATPEAAEWNGWGTALKPAHEPIVLARKPLSEKSVAANVLRWGTGAINIDGCRIGDTRAVPASLSKNKTPNGILGEFGGGHPKELDPNLGRWPANIVHDGSDEVLAEFPETESGYSDGSKAGVQQAVFGKFGAGTFAETYGDSGSAARFFYQARATSAERGEGNNHPTVKPVDLMRWLCRLVTPKGGTVLDPFCGSGSTLIAADAEQFDAIGCELSPEYAAIAERRIRASAGMFAQV